MWSDCDGFWCKWRKHITNTNSLNLYIPHVEYYRKSFKYADGTVWSGVSNNIQNAPSVEACKYAFKNVIWSTRTHAEGTTITYERFGIIFMCMIYIW